MTFYPKKEPKFPKFHYLISCVFAHFGADFSLQSALQMQKCIVESFSGYLKHFPNSGKYLSKKNYGHTMRNTEYKARK